VARGPSSKSAKIAAREDVADGYVAVGRVLGAFGIKGDIKVEPMAPPQTFKTRNRLTLRGAVREIERSRRHKGVLLLKLSGIEVREDIAEYRGEYLQVPETDLESLGEDEYYRFQLIGLRVVSTEGEELGEVAEILERPANDVFVVRGPKGEVLVPAADDIVQSVDIEAGVVTIEVIPGLLP
jgi:16S rRNA processing protein RimM